MFTGELVEKIYLECSHIFFDDVDYLIKSMNNNKLVRLEFKSLTPDVFLTFELLKVNRSLKFLEIHADEFGTDFFEKLADSIMLNSSLTRLKLISNTNVNITNIFFKVVETNKGITNFSLACSSFTQPDSVLKLMASLKINTGLKKFELIYRALKHNELIAISQYLSQNVTLTNFNFVCNNMNDDASLSFARCLNKSSSLKSFGLVVLCEISEYAVNKITDSLSKNSALRKISLGLDFVDKIDAVTNITQLNYQMRKLSLKNSRFCNEGYDKIAEYLKTNQTLKSLNLSFANISTYGVTTIANALEMNQTLQKLILQFNRIDNEGATAIARMLITNQALQMLDLRVNMICDDGFTEIVNALGINQTLTRLYISHNKITNFDKFITSIKNNYTLIYIDIEHKHPVIKKILNRNNKIYQNMLFKKVKAIVA